MTLEEALKAQMEGKKIDVFVVADGDAEVNVRSTEKGDYMVDIKTDKPLKFDFRIVEEETDG